MSKSENFETTQKSESSIDYAYKFKECLDYIECGSFEKDLERVEKTLLTSNNKVFTSNKKDNPKLGTLIGKSLFFTALSDEKIIKNSELLTQLFLGTVKKEHSTIYKFKGFYCTKSERQTTVSL